MAVLRVQNLQIVHQRTLIEPFDWHVNAGEKWAILGANGAGKSSLLHALLGIERGALAQVFYGEQSLQSLSAKQQAQQRVWIPQRYDEPFTITVRHALDSVNGARIDECLREFGLLAQQNAWVHELSGGERQRLTWAMAAARHTSDTQLWLLDEPLAAQDLAWQHRLLKKLSELPCAVIAAVHDLNQVAQFATHALLLSTSSSGSVAQSGLVADMMQESLLGDVYGVQLHQDWSQMDARHWWHVVGV